VCAGDNHSCAVRASGSMVCWGSNSSGQLGDGSMTDRTEPASVSSLTDAVSCTAGTSHTCALRAGGDVACWGYVRLDESPDGHTHPTPVAVSGVSDVVALTAGTLHSCALRADGAVLCWGDDTEQQLGDPVRNTNTPLLVAWPP
jgi:alpha-tubulin suppressor-like RCC1 family protein